MVWYNESLLKLYRATESTCTLIAADGSLPHFGFGQNLKKGADVILRCLNFLVKITCSLSNSDEDSSLLLTAAKSVLIRSSEKTPEQPQKHLTPFQIGRPSVISIRKYSRRHPLQGREQCLCKGGASQGH